MARTICMPADVEQWYETLAESEYLFAKQIKTALLKHNVYALRNIADILHTRANKLHEENMKLSKSVASKMSQERICVLVGLAVYLRQQASTFSP